MQAEWAPSRSSESFSLGAWLVDPRHLSRGELALAFLIYAACGELGFVVSTEYWFLPAGVRIAALLRMQTTQWPVLLLAEWLAIAVYETTVGPGYRTSLGALLGVVGPFFCTGAFIYVWRRTACPDPAEAPRKLIKLLTSIVLAAGAAAVVLSLMLVSEGRLGFDRFAWNVASYWGGDVVGVLVISPLLIQLGQPRPIWMRREVWRYCLTTMLPLWVALLLAMGFAPSVVPHLVLIVLLPPVWMAFKAGWRGASLSLTLTSIALYMVPDAVRPTLQPSLVQLLVAIMGFLTLLLGSLVNAERFSREKLDAHLTKLAEANDALIKLARKFGHDSAASHGSARYEMVTCTNSFHGRTLGGIAATGQDKVKKGFEPLLEGFTHVPFNDCDALRAAVGPQTAAILFEVVQGEGGIHVATPEFLQTARELRDEFGLLVMLDEVQCGFGRTGDWNAWETVLRDVDGEFSPDAVSWAKGMGGGFPIGGIWASDRLAPGADFRVCDVLGPGTHGSTFGGTPLASAVGMAVLKTIEEDGLIDNARSLGEQIRTAVSSWNHPLIAAIRGLGLLIGFVIDETALSDCVAFGESGQTPSLFVVNQLMKDADLLTVPAGANVVRWLPPLNVTEEEVEEALRRMRHTLDQLLKR